MFSMFNLLSKKKRVILDTNILLLPGQSGIDIFAEINNAVTEPYELCWLEGTLQELTKIMEGKTKLKHKSDKFNAKLGIIMGKQKGLKTISHSLKNVDDAIVDLSSSNIYIVTLDKELQKRVEEKGAKLLLLRQQKYFVVK